jgi:hypothetical protein
VQGKASSRQGIYQILPGHVFNLRNEKLKLLHNLKIIGKAATSPNPVNLQ